MADIGGSVALGVGLTALQMLDQATGQRALTCLLLRKPVQ